MNLVAMVWRKCSESSSLSNTGRTSWNGRKGCQVRAGLTVEPYNVHWLVFCQRPSESSTYLSAITRRLARGCRVGVGDDVELDGVAVGGGVIKMSEDGSMLSRSINGQRKVGGGVGRGTGLPATTGEVVAMMARAARMAGDGERGREREKACSRGWRWGWSGWRSEEGDDCLEEPFQRPCFGLAMIRESTEDVPRESCGHGVA